MVTLVGVSTSSGPQALEQVNFEMMQSAIFQSLTPLESCICFALSRYRRAYASRKDEPPGLQGFLQLIAGNQSTNRARSRFLSEFRACWAEHHDDRVILQCLVWIIAVVGATEPEQPTDHEDFSRLWRGIFEYSGCLYSQEALHDILCDFYHKDMFLEQAEALRRGCLPPEPVNTSSIVGDNIGISD